MSRRGGLCPIHLHAAGNADGRPLSRTGNSGAAANPSTGAATGGGKRAECLVAAQGKKGQDRQDELQLCMAQGHVECLKQAIDQKVVGPQRKDFIKNCMREE